MVLLEDEEVLLVEVLSVTAEGETELTSELASLAAATGAVVATGATELEEDDESGFCLVGHAAAEIAETAMSMVWSFMMLGELLRNASREWKNRASGLEQATSALGGRRGFEW